MSRRAFKVPTPDGRWLAAEAAGPEDGDLVVFHVGTPASHHLFEGHVRECEQRGLRIVCASRPGYGGSPRQPGRSSADNPADTLAVLELLGVDSAYVVGHSGGGGPALADAAKLGDRVRAVAVASSLAPRPAMGDRWYEDFAEESSEEFRAVREGEPSLRRFLAPWAEGMREVKSGEQIKDNPDFGRLYSPADRECLQGEYLAFALEAHSLIGHDRTDGWVDDDFAMCDEWGFALSDIAIPVTIWQGDEDRFIPRAHAEWLWQNVPGAKFELLSGEGHVSVYARRFGDVLDELTRC